MSYKDCFRKYHIGFFLTVIITAVFLYFGQAKAGFFIDEIYTYGLSNSHFAPYLSDVAGGDLNNQIISNGDLVSYVTVDKGEEFDFASVYYNQERDVHPPLYYWLFNIASSLTPGLFSKWTGLALNYAVLLGTLLMLMMICNELFGKGKAKYWAIALYGLSYAGISTAVYIRMYELMTLFTLLLVYFLIKLIREKSIKYCIASGIAIFLGMMTQYYFVVYAFFSCLGVFIYLFVKKEYKILAVFSLCAFLGVVLMILVFPASIKHIFVGNGQVVSGGVAVSNILDVSQWISRLWNYMLFVGRGITVACILAAVLFIVLLVKKRLSFPIEIILIVVPALLTWTMIALMAAVVEERYVYNIIPVFVIGVVYLVQKSNLKDAALVISAAATFMFIGCNYEYIRPQCIEQNMIISKYASSPCVYITDNMFAPMTADFTQLLLFEDVFTTSDTSSALLEEYVKGNSQVVVYVDTNKEWSSGFDGEEKMKALKQSLNYSQSTEILNNTLSNVYVMTK